MKTYVISYDLRNHEKYGDYKVLHDAIKTFPVWGKITESFWAVQTNKTTSEVRDFLLTKIDSNDRLFVLLSGGVAAWRNSICSDQWIKDNI